MKRAFATAAIFANPVPSDDNAIAELVEVHRPRTGLRIEICEEPADSGRSTVETRDAPIRAGSITLTKGDIAIGVHEDARIAVPEKRELETTLERHLLSRVVSQRQAGAKIRVQRARLPRERVRG